MKTKAFKKLYTALSEIFIESEEWLSIDELLKKRNRLISIVLLNIDDDLVEKFIEPFTEELDINLLLSSEGKNDKIKFYLYKLRELNLFFQNPEYAKLLFQSPISDESMSTEYNLIVITHYLYNLTVGEIQYCCLKYNIDFLSICSEVDFDCSNIDCGISLYAEGKEKNKAKQNNLNPFPQIFNCDDNRAYNVFKEWVDGHTDKFLDYSFIFQKMISPQENLIRKKYPQLSFMLFLKENDFLTKVEYESFTKKASFSSKADVPIRLTRYYKIKEKYYPPNSDKSEKTAEVRN
jgi:hypothetical protein